jgi:two-component system, LytTR family, sensor histidine kinase AlgZ
MQGIIRQNPELPALPDLRNLGTILRILVAVNGAALVVAFTRAPQLAQVAREWVALVALVEPHLLLELALLWLLKPLLARLHYDHGVAAVALLTVGVSAAAHIPASYARGFDGNGLFRHVVLALLAAGVLLAYFRLRARALSPALVEARLQALQARIRPHFLFNSINAVLSLVRSEPQRAETALEDLADLFRVLMRDNRDLAPLADEVELCRQYLELEKLRLGERLVVDWNVKSMPGDALVPPLMLQPLLENAVYHGIEPSVEPGTLSINIFLSRDEVHAILKNPCPATGRSHHSGNKMALANIRERLALHFDAEAALDSKVTRDGYEVHIRVPYRTAQAEAPTAAAVRREPTLKPVARPSASRHANPRIALPVAMLHHPEVSRA